MDMGPRCARLLAVLLLLGLCALVGAQKPESEECVMEVSARKDCGYPGISPQDCASRKCCFSDAIPQVPWCFFPLSVH
ncbi:Trefoil factor 2, partial [Eschrichtius robustus]|nr:Trefoil factor 2 [Eschrichtius robustus]